MRYWITPDGSYYEGDNVAAGSIEVLQRPDALHDWNGITWVLNPVRAVDVASKKIEDKIDLYADSVAEAKGYRRVGVTPSNSCIGYAGYPNAYQAQGIAFGQWLAGCWPIVYAFQATVQADIAAGTRTIPITDADMDSLTNELINILDTTHPMVWPA